MRPISRRNYRFIMRPTLPWLKKAATNLSSIFCFVISVQQLDVPLHYLFSVLLLPIAVLVDCLYHRASISSVREYLPKLCLQFIDFQLERDGARLLILMIEWGQPGLAINSTYVCWKCIPWACLSRYWGMHFGVLWGWKLYTGNLGLSKAL